MALTISVFLADDNLITREGVRALLALEPDLEIVGAATDYDTLVAGAEELAPQVVVGDIRMPLTFQQEGIAADAVEASMPIRGGVGPYARVRRRRTTSRRNLADRLSKLDALVQYWHPLCDIHDGHEAELEVRAELGGSFQKTQGIVGLHHRVAAFAVHSVEELMKRLVGRWAPFAEHFEAPGDPGLVLTR